MSTHPSPSAEHLALPEEPEAIAWGKVLGIGIGALVLFALSVLLTLRIMNAREKALQPDGPDPIPAQVGQSEIGIVDQAPFDVSRSLQAYREDRLTRLSSWGWVDRKAGLLHMPIEEAMDRVVKEHRK